MTGRGLHTKAANLREEGKFFDSIKLIIDAIRYYEKDGDFIGLTDALGDAVLSFRHLYFETKEISYLILALSHAQAVVAIAREKDLKGDLSRPLFNLGKVEEDLKNYKEAQDVYLEAIKLFESQNPTKHNRSGVLADMKIHLAVAKYKSGEKLAFGEALAAISDLEKSDEREISKYNYDVWLSGAHMKLAEMLKNDDPDKAKDHSMKAKKIIDANPDLKIRRKQWEETKY